MWQSPFVTGVPVAKSRLHLGHVFRTVLSVLELETLMCIRSMIRSVVLRITDSGHQLFTPQQQRRRGDGAAGKARARGERREAVGA